MSATKLAIALLLATVIGCDQAPGVSQSELQTEFPGEVCDIGALGTFEADNCDGTNGVGNGKVLCFTHDGPVAGCWVAYADGVGGPGVPAFYAECVDVCPAAEGSR